jgi:hypothetical protein
LLVLAVVATAIAEDPAQVKKKRRRYTDRVKMHDAPFDLEAPAEEEESSLPRPVPAVDDRTPVYDVEDFVPTWQLHQMVTPRASDKPKKKDNWILPPAVDGVEIEEEDAEPSGWGWLADDAEKLRKREEGARKAREEEQQTEREYEARPLAIRRGDSTGLTLDTRLRPAAGTTPVEDLMLTDRAGQDDQESSERESARERRASELSRRAAKRERDENGARDERRDEQGEEETTSFGMDGLWGRGESGVADRDERPALRRTQQLLREARTAPDKDPTPGPPRRETSPYRTHVLGEAKPQPGGTVLAGDGRLRQPGTAWGTANPSQGTTFTPVSPGLGGMTPPSLGSARTISPLATTPSASPGGMTTRALQPTQPASPIKSLEDPWSRTRGASRLGGDSAIQSGISVEGSGLGNGGASPFGQQ